MEKYSLNNLDAWRFTVDERQYFKKALEKLDQERITDFIDELEFICHQFKIILDRIPTDKGKKRPVLPIDRYTPNQDKKRITGRLQKAIAELDYLYNHNFLLGIGPGYITPVVKYPKVVIPAKAGIQKETGCRIKSGMTELAI